VDSIAEYFLLKTAVNQKRCEIADVSDVTNDLVTNQIKQWIAE